jgi:hypothetical protein
VARCVPLLSTAWVAQLTRCPVMLPLDFFVQVEILKLCFLFNLLYELTIALTFENSHQLDLWRQQVSKCTQQDFTPQQPCLTRPRALVRRVITVHTDLHHQMVFPVQLENIVQGQVLMLSLAHVSLGTIVNKAVPIVQEVHVTLSTTALAETKTNHHAKLRQGTSVLLPLL